MTPSTWPRLLNGTDHASVVLAVPVLKRSLHKLIQFKYAQTAGNHSSCFTGHFGGRDAQWLSVALWPVAQPNNSCSTLGVAAIEHGYPLSLFGRSYSRRGVSVLCLRDI